MNNMGNEGGACDARVFLLLLTRPRPVPGQASGPEGGARRSKVALTKREDKAGGKRREVGRPATAYSCTKASNSGRGERSSDNRRADLQSTDLQRCIRLSASF